MIKVFHKFPDLHNNVSLDLVEVSPALSEIQEKTLMGQLSDVQEDKEERQLGTTNSKSQGNEVQLNNYCVKHYI